LFNRAIELDADFASAYAMAALCYNIRKGEGWMIDPVKESAQAVRLARRAMELGKDDALALALSGGVFAHMGRDLNTGVALTDRALALNPNLAAAWWTGAWLKIWLGEPETAIEYFGRAIRLSPLDPYLPRMQNGMAHAHFHAGRHSEASSWAAMVLRELPDFHDGLRITAASNALAGRMEEAHEAIERLRRLDPALRISKLRELQGPYRRPEDIARYEGALRRRVSPNDHPPPRRNPRDGCGRLQQAHRRG
jgi:adenylate cyclase